MGNVRRAGWNAGRFRDMSLESWWEAVSASGEGWRQNDIRVFGQWHKEPRLTAWWGPAYQYANVKWPQRSMSKRCRRSRHRWKPWPRFHTMGSWSMGTAMDRTAWVGTVTTSPKSIRRALPASVWGPRTFKVRDRRTKAVVNIELHHGDLLVMEHLQEVHDHSVPKRAKVSAPRMNFTFRRLV